MKHRHILITLLLCSLLCTGCTQVEDTYCKYPCRFVFNTMHHGMSLALTTTLGSVGVFCDVSEVMDRGVHYYRFQTNHGSVDSVIFTREDNLTTVRLGLNNGLLIGHSNLDNPGLLLAYDAQCRNCFDPEAIPVRSYRLVMEPSGLATCPNCHRSYNLNTGGNVVGASGKPLWRYRNAVYSGAGVVSVVN